MFRATVLTLYPEMFPGALGLSLAGRALEAGTWSLEAVQIRDFATDKHRTVDDTPAGGGAGMVMRADVLAKAIDHASPEGDPRPRLLMSPRGKPLTQARVRELAAGPGAVIVCGRFEGVDQRVIDARGLEEVSVGDFILSGGEPAALVLLDAVVRLLPGVMGNDAVGRRGELRERAARTSALYPAAGVRGPADPRRADLRQPRQDRRMAARRSREADRRAAAGSAVGRAAQPGHEIIDGQEQADRDDEAAHGVLRHALGDPDAGIAAQRHAGDHDQRLQPGDDAAGDEDDDGDGGDDHGQQFFSALSRW